MIRVANKYKFTQYACAVLLILTSIGLAFLSLLHLGEIASGVLLYIAQAFLLAGSIFGLDYYVQRLTHYSGNPSGNPQQQPA